eukprot:1161914-Pelagomonas_calceolata.AAC.6
MSPFPNGFFAQNNAPFNDLGSHIPRCVKSAMMNFPLALIWSLLAALIPGLWKRTDMAKSVAESGPASSELDAKGSGKKET